MTTMGDRDGFYTKSGTHTHGSYHSGSTHAQYPIGIRTVFIEL
jgi:hypothetical protein